MENYSFGSDDDSSKFESKKIDKTAENSTDDDDDDDSEKSFFAKIFNKKDREDKPEEDTREDKQEKPNGILDRFKRKAEKELPPLPNESAEINEQDSKEELTSEEKQLAVKTVAEGLAAEVPDHPIDAEIPPELAEDIAAKRFLENAALSGDIESAAETSMGELGLDPTIVNQYEAKIEPQANTEADEPQISPDKEIKEETAAVPSEEVKDGVDANETLPESELETSEESNNTETLDDSNHQPETPPLEHDASNPAETIPEEPSDTEATPTTPAAAAAKSGTPPPPPPPPLRPVMGFGGGFMPPSPNAPSANETLSPWLNNSNQKTEVIQEYQYDRANPAITALIGGVIGYFIGRRRGKIKTEKKLLPIQKKLTKQVEDLHWEIKRKEIAIRKAAYEKSKVDHFVILDKTANNNIQPSKNVESRESKQTFPEQTIQAEKPISRRSAPEARELHGIKNAKEHLGKVVINAEAINVAPVLNQPESRISNKGIATSVEALRTAPNPEIRYVAEKERNVETLNRNELLRISEKIIIDGTSLRQIYESRLVGERGLRRLVAEHFRGGDVKKVLRREILEHEIDFERDPAIRDVAVDQVGPTSSATMAQNNKLTLEKLVEQASAGFGDSEAQAYYRARAAHESEEIKKKNKQQKIIDVSLASTIIGLSALVIILLLTHH